MAYSKEELKRLSDKVKGGSYINNKDITDKGVRICLINWILDGKVEPIHFFNEGWESIRDAKGNVTGQRPLRFRVDDEIPDGVDWHEGEYKGKKTVNTPRTAAGFVCYVPSSGAIKVGSFTSPGISGALLDMLDSDSELYQEDLSQVDIILIKKDNKYSASAVVRKDKDKVNKDINALLGSFQFSWSKFLDGDDRPFDGGDRYFEFTNGEEPEPEKETPKIEKKAAPAVTAQQEEDFKDWKNYKVNGGALLGSASYEKLLEYREKIEKLGKTNLPVYAFVTYGIEHFNDDVAPTDQLEENDIAF